MRTGLKGVMMQHKITLLKLMRHLRGGPVRVGAGAAAYVSSSEDQITRRVVVDRAQQSARTDTHFVKAITAGDAARDRRIWDEAAKHYRVALERCPLHSGYRVQFAHMVKECENFSEAELHYRIALANGAPPHHVQQHLNFVCERTGGPTYHGAPLNLDLPLQQAPAGIEDIHSLAYILWQNWSVSDEECLELLRSFPSVRQLSATMIAHRRFEERNGRFLTLLKAKP